MAAEVGRVIGIHSVDAWKEHFIKGVESKKMVVVDFTATWCGPCRIIAPIFADLAKEFQNAFFLKVDVDELPSVAEEFKVEAMPTFLFLVEGKEVDKIVGAKKEDLISMVHRIAASIQVADV